MIYALAEDTRMKVVKEIALTLMGNDPAHGWPHVLRVLELSKKIIENERLNVDENALVIATYLHDVGRFIAGEGHHAIKSANFSERLLKALGFEKEFIDEVKEIIISHSYTLALKASSLEAKVLSDADKLDALGAIGIARAIHHGCKSGRNFDESIKHMEDKLLKLPDLMYFAYSRIEALKRVELVRKFIEEYKRERPRL